MPNTYFRFKQFNIEQADVPMKVTTDGCLFGAWVASQSINPLRILDIGAGTGLLSLMLAQSFKNARVDAIEIDPIAGVGADGNFKDSLWAERLFLHECGLQDYESESKYDLIISNPPFFSNHIQSGQVAPNLAIHNDTLSQQDLLDGLLIWLSEKGTAFVMYPEQEMDLFIILARTSQLYCSHRVDVRDTKGSQVLRSMSIFSRIEGVDSDTQEHCIKELNGEYTEDFIELLKAYYLYL